MKVTQHFGRIEQKRINLLKGMLAVGDFLAAVHNAVLARPHHGGAPCAVRTVCEKSAIFHYWCLVFGVYDGHGHPHTIVILCCWHGT